MKKKSGKMVALVLICVQLIALMTISINATAFNGAVNAAMIVYQTDADLMTIDGKISANEAWKNVDWSSQSFRYAGSANSSFRFKAMWAKKDADFYLYVLVDVSDGTACTATDYNWANDSLKVVIDETCTIADGAKIEDGAIAADAGRYDNTPVWAQRSTSGFFAYNNKNGYYKISEKGDATGYYMEASIKLKVAVENNTQMKMNVLLQDGDNGSNNAQSVWSVNDADWESGKKDVLYADHAGTITFSDTMVKNDVDDTLVGSVATLYQTSVSSMTIDGIVSANEAWEGVEWNTQNYKIGSDSLEDSFRFKAMWAKEGDKAYIYLLIDVNDGTPCTATSYNRANDSLQVLLDQDCSLANGVKYQDSSISIEDGRYNTTPLWAQRSAPGFGSYNNKAGTYKVTEKADQSGYIVEASITLTDANYVAEGAKMRMNLLMQDGDNNANYAQRIWSFDSTAWSSGKTDKLYADHAGTLVFTEKEAVIPATTIRMDTVQTTAVSEDQTFDVRFVATVDSAAIENADKINFLVSATYIQNNQSNTVAEKTFAVYTVYRSILANGEKIDAPEGESFALLIITDIPKDVTVTFNITPEIVYKDATVATGKTVHLTFPNI